MVQQTIKYCAEDHSGEVGLLKDVPIVWDLGSIQVLRPDFFPMSRHFSDMGNRVKGGYQAEEGETEIKGATSEADGRT